MRLGVTTLQVPVAALRPGDILRPTNREVTSYPTAGVRTPAGKVDLILRRPSGKRQNVTFNRRTLVTIDRKDESC